MPFSVIIFQGPVLVQGVGTSMYIEGYAEGNMQDRSLIKRKMRRQVVQAIFS